MKSNTHTSLYHHAAIAVAALALSTSANAADVVRHSLLGGSKFPISRAIEVPAGSTIIFHSGTTPLPLDPKAAPGSAAYWGDTKTQAESVFANMKTSLDDLGLSFGDVVAMKVFLVGDPEKGGKMDFVGFMSSYSQHFGTAAQPNLPARSTIQVVALTTPGILVEVEVQLVRKAKK